MDLVGWCKSIAAWRMGEALCLSVLFTWLLPEARRLAEEHGGPVYVHGAAVDLMPEHLAGMAILAEPCPVPPLGTLAGPLPVKGFGAFISVRLVGKVKQGSHPGGQRVFGALTRPTCALTEVVKEGITWRRERAGTPVPVPGTVSIRWPGEGVAWHGRGHRAATDVQPRAHASQVSWRICRNDADVNAELKGRQRA